MIFLIINRISVYHIYFLEKDILGEAVWKHLREILYHRLDRQLAEAVVQFSVTELLEDEDEELR